MSAPHPRYQDDTPSLKRVLAAFAPLPNALPGELVPLNSHPRDLDKSSECFCSDIGCPDPLPNNCPKLPAPETPANRLDDLAILLRQLTWGEMDEFSSGIGADPKTIHQWSTK